MEKACTCTGLACVNDKFKCESCKDRKGAKPMRMSEEQIEKWVTDYHNQAPDDPITLEDLREAFAQGYKLADSEAWVDVRERLPEQDISVLVLNQTSRWYAVCKIEYYTNIHGKEAFNFVTEYGESSGKVTHWQPLPTPPQTEDAK